MTHLASLLAVATIFIGLWAIYSQGGGAYNQDKTTCAEIWAKNAGGDLCVGGGDVITGFYGIMHQVGTIFFTPLHMHTG